MRWIFRALGLVMVMLAIVLGALFFLPGERIARIAADQITKATGRQVTMSGDTKISFYPILGVSTGAVEIANADWSDAGPMLRADSLKIGVEPQALFGGDIRITGLEAVNPAIRLERARDGQVNWELGVEGVAPSGQSDGPLATSNRLALTLDRALITGASLSYTDHATGTVQAFSNLDFDLRWPDYDGTATFEAVLRQGSAPVTLAGHLDQVGQFIDGAVTGLSARLSGPGAAWPLPGAAGRNRNSRGGSTLTLAIPMPFWRPLALTGWNCPPALGPASRAARISPSLMRSISRCAI
ncbi:AsmA family protein [Roseovarius sp. MS2]|uniref:AsmA family protein n=1 Tax=Roseovarius sp. MS2 TaxID=3390728 RepID=UPI003EDBE0E8